MSTERLELMRYFTEGMPSWIGFVQMNTSNTECTFQITFPIMRSLNSIKSMSRSRLTAQLAGPLGAGLVFLLVPYLDGPMRPLLC